MIKGPFQNFFNLPLYVFNMPQIMPEIIILIYIWCSSIRSMPKSSTSDITAICLNGSDVTDGQQVWGNPCRT